MQGDTFSGLLGIIFSSYFAFYILLFFLSAFSYDNVIAMR